MRVSYDPDADALYIKLREGKYVESEEIDKDIIVDYGEDGKVLAIEVLNVSSHLKELSELRNIPVLK